MLGTYSQKSCIVARGCFEFMLVRDLFAKQQQFREVRLVYAFSKSWATFFFSNTLLIYLFTMQCKDELIRYPIGQRNFLSLCACNMVKWPPSMTYTLVRSIALTTMVFIFLNIWPLGIPLEVEFMQPTPKIQKMRYDNDDGNTDLKRLGNFDP